MYNHLKFCAVQYTKKHFAIHVVNPLKVLTIETSLLYQDCHSHVHVHVYTCTCTISTVGQSASILSFKSTCMRIFFIVCRLTFSTSLPSSQASTTSTRASTRTATKTIRGQLRE